MPYLSWNNKSRKLRSILASPMIHKVTHLVLYALHFMIGHLNIVGFGIRVTLLLPKDAVVVEEWVEV